MSQKKAKMSRKILRKFCEKNAKRKKLHKKWKLCKIKENFAKNTEFLKTNAKFFEKKFQKFIKKRLNFENNKKDGFIREPN